MNKIIFCFLILSQTVVAQNTTIYKRQKDSTNLSKQIITNSLVGTSYFGSLLTLQNVWYKENYQQEFHFFNDGKNWFQMDKLGHGYTSYELTRGISELYEWAGTTLSS